MRYLAAQRTFSTFEYYDYSMATLTEKETRFYTEKWPITRVHKSRYILRNGVLYYGLPTFLLTYTNNHRFNFSHFDLLEFMIGLVLWPIMGALWGLWMFNATEKQYRKLMLQRDGLAS